LQTFEASVSPRWIEKLTSTVCLRYLLARYNDLTAFDYQGETAGFTLGYPVKDWFYLYGGWSATRLYFRQDEAEFFKMFDAQIGIWRRQPLLKHATLF
jgi:hypothetical protein